MAQNTSHAVMAQRTESPDSLDDFPTPPWATRAFVEHVLGGKASTGGLHVLEPACGLVIWPPYFIAATPTYGRRATWRYKKPLVV